MNYQNVFLLHLHAFSARARDRNDCDRDSGLTGIRLSEQVSYIYTYIYIKYRYCSFLEGEKAKAVRSSVSRRREEKKRIGHDRDRLSRYEREDGRFLNVT